MKHSFEKIGDHWEPKQHRGPSDEQAARSTPGRGETAGGVDANAPKQHLHEIVKRLGVPGRSRMTKAEPVAGIDKANQRATRAAR